MAIQPENNTMDGMAEGTPNGSRSMMRNSTSGEWPPETRAVRQHLVDAIRTAEASA